ncbi:hypothetical protein MPQ_2772 [Methylovorus sp. MP688]|nr:hypothetical protein MPQ_2772 [Methylovorus sp. MP688]
MLKCMNDLLDFLQISGHRIMPTWMPGMAFSDTTDTVG